MEPDWDDLFSVGEIMGGLPARRASTLLFAIEGRTAQFMARSRRAMARDYSGQTVEQEEQAFLSAMSEGARLPLAPTIQDLERYAPGWAALIPAEPSIRAALARLMGEKYRIPADRTPRLQHALGLHEPETMERFEALYGAPVDSIFTHKPIWRERFRWLRSRLATRLETLPPFWTAFALTLTETVGAGVLALPIAFAELGVAGAVILLLVLGLISILTIAAMAEAVARNGNIRYGHAYFGKLVGDYLGKPGVMILTPALFVLNTLLLLAYAIGFSSTLADVVGLSPMIWAAALLLLLLVILRKESMNATVASALLVGFCTISLLVILSLFAVPHLDASYLRHSEIPFVGGTSFDAGVIELIFGVALLALFGHTSTANCAAVVLDRDPSARSLIRGCAAALVAATLLYVLWIAMVNGAVGPERLAGERGTALIPLADVTGPAVNVLGLIFVVLAMGMASVHMGWGLANSVREWLPLSWGSESRSLLAAHPDAARKLLSLLPLIAVFVFVELLFGLDRESFSGPLGFLGVIAAPLVAGIFSMMMLAAARRKGDCIVEYTWGFLGSRVVVIGVCAMFLAAILLHGLVIWQEPAQRVLALAVSAITVIFLVVAARGSMAPRVVAEIRYAERDEMAEPAVSIVAAGRGMTGATYAIVADESATEAHSWRAEKTLRHAIEIELPPAPVEELKVWVHQLMPNGASRPVPATLALNGDEPFHLDQSTGKIVVPVNGEAQRLTVRPLPANTTPGVH